jgi:hypothetical protein
MELMLLASNETRSIKFEASAPEIDAFGLLGDILPRAHGLPPPHLFFLLFLLLTPENQGLATPELMIREVRWEREVKIRTCERARSILL